MGLILSEPMKEVVEIPKALAKFPLKTQNFTQNALTGSAHRPREKRAKKTQTKHQPQKKSFFSQEVLCF
jgi:hypothetical protein